MISNWEDFRREVLNLNGTRKHRVNNSLGVYNSYKWIRKHKWLNIGRPLTEHEFYSIIRKINNYLADELMRGNDITLPCNMGRLEIRKNTPKVSLENGRVKTDLPIDWDRTLKLWYEDQESFENKTLIKMEEKEIFKVYFNRLKCDFNNQSFYEFIINRDIKKRLKQKIKEGHIDAFTF